MNRSRFALITSVSAVLAISACTPANNGAEVQFSSSAAPSILLNRLSKRGSAAFCYTLRDTTGPKSDAIFEKLKANAERATRKWVGALQGQPGWKFPAASIVITHIRKPSCPLDGEMVSVNFFVDPKVYQKSCSELYKSRGWQVSEGGCRSFAEVGGRMVWLNPPDTSDAMLDSAFTHEFGHILGMGDSYGVGGNQPEGVMGTYGMKDLSSDDIAGMRSIWAAKYNGNPMPRCPPGYRVHFRDPARNYTVCSKGT